MTNTNELSIFDNIYDVDMSVMQMESVATDLVFLLKHSGLSRSELANKLDWKKSRVTKVLSGDENLTIKTITSVAECLGYGFDVVFYNENYDQPKQPWAIDRENKAIQPEVVYLESSIEIKRQEPEEVFKDLLAGEEASYYICVSKNKNSDSKTIRSIQPVRNTCIAKKEFRLDIPVPKSYSFISSLEDKDKEQWMTT